VVGLIFCETVLIICKLNYHDGQDVITEFPNFYLLANKLIIMGKNNLTLYAYLEREYFLLGKTKRGSSRLIRQEENLI
jgi:hypothetical protein